MHNFFEKKWVTKTFLGSRVFVLIQQKKSYKHEGTKTPSRSWSLCFFCNSKLCKWITNNMKLDNAIIICPTEIMVKKIEEFEKTVTYIAYKSGHLQGRNMISRGNESSLKAMQSLLLLLSLIFCSTLRKHLQDLEVVWGAQLPVPIEHVVLPMKDTCTAISVLRRYTEKRNGPWFQWLLHHIWHSYNLAGKKSFSKAWPSCFVYCVSIAKRRSCASVDNNFSTTKKWLVGDLLRYVVALGGSFHSSSSSESCKGFKKLCISW